MKKITFKNITSLLPQPKSNCHEAWEFRFLFAEGAPRRLICVEVDAALNMLRLTFPMVSNNGRGRIWLKRSELNELDNADIADFVRLVTELQAISNLEVLVSPLAHSLIARRIGAAELFENPYVMVDKHHKPRNYDDPKYQIQESNPYSFTRVGAARSRTKPILDSSGQ